MKKASKFAVIITAALLVICGIFSGCGQQDTRSMPDDTEASVSETTSHREVEFTKTADGVEIVNEVTDIDVPSEITEEKTEEPTDVLRGFSGQDKENTTKYTTEVPVKNKNTECEYIGNKNSKVFHYPWCASVKKMKESNKEFYNCSSSEMIAKGYKPCHNCNP